MLKCHIRFVAAIIGVPMSIHSAVNDGFSGYDSTVLYSHCVRGIAEAPVVAAVCQFECDAW